MKKTDKIQESEEDSITEVDFSGLILGFSSAALYYMGAVAANPDESLEETNLPLAKQNLNIIKLLEQKTKGNLSPEEQSLIQSVLKNLESKLNESPSAPGKNKK